MRSRRFIQSVIIVVTAWVVMSCTDPTEKILGHWDNGQVKMKKVYFNHRDTSQFLLLSYWADDQLSEYANFIAKARHGWTVTYHQNGKVKDSIFYRENIPVTNAKGLHANGQPSYEGVYDDLGNKDGSWLFYDTNGRVREKSTFVSGAPVATYYFDGLGGMIGEIKYYVATHGGVQEELHYKNGFRSGLYVSYFDNGNIATKGQYLDGPDDGVWTDFYRSGAKLKEYRREEDQVINMWDENWLQVVKNGNGKWVTFVYCRNGKPRYKFVDHYRDGFVYRTVKKRMNSCR